MKPKLVTLAMTGASGAAYTLRLFECLLAEGIHVQFLTSKPGQIVVGTETDLKLTGNPQRMRKTLAEYFKVDESQISVYAKDQWSAPPASGSSVADAMVVCPCTTGSLAAIAAGTSDNLIHRAADVALKERKNVNYHATRGAILDHTPGEHVTSVAGWCGDPAAQSRFLSRRQLSRRLDRLCGRARTRSTRYRQ